ARGPAPRSSPRPGGPQGDRDAVQLGPRHPRFAGHRITSLLLAFNFPPHGGGIARMMGQLALRYPRNSLVVSTGAYPGAAASDAPRWGQAAVGVAISEWTARLARTVLERLGCTALARGVEVVPLGTTPEHFRPGVDSRDVRARYGLDGGPWLLTVARLEWHK